MLARLQQGLLKVSAVALFTSVLPPSAAIAATEKSPDQLEDATWVTLEGSVDSVFADSFTLRYGDNAITVEMDDGDRDADGYKLLSGDKVIVSGMVDDDLFEITTIEAYSVFVENIGTTFYASPIDEDRGNQLFMYTAWMPVEEFRTTLTGTVTEINSGEFTLDYGTSSIRVDVGEMSYDPLSDDGYLQIKVGDRVQVSGEIDSGFFTGREMAAKTVVSLS